MDGKKEKKPYAVAFKNCYQEELNQFFARCLPQSGRVFEPEGRHAYLQNIVLNFEKFWLLLMDKEIIGTVGIARMPSASCCELKCLYLLREYQGYGYGTKLIKLAMNYGKNIGSYRWMYLDTRKTSENAIKLYRKMGFQPTKRYHDNPYADVFMKCIL